MVAHDEFVGDVMRWIVPLAVLATIAWNGFVNALPLNGLQTGQISDRFQVYFTPSGYVFAIWSVIYVGLAIYAWERFKERTPGRLRVLDGPVLASCIFNVAWLAAWHYELYPLSLAVMLALLGSVAVAFSRLRGAPHGLFSIYLGWVTVATLANLCVVLEAEAARPFGMDALQFALAMTGVAGVIGAVVALRFRDILFVSVFIWAAIGIAVRPEQAPVMQVAAWLLAGTMTVALFGLCVRRKAAARNNAQQEPPRMYDVMARP